MDASSSQIQVRLLPEEVEQPDRVRAAVERQLRKEGRPALAPDDVLHVLRKSWDARKKPVRAQLLVGWNAGAAKAEVHPWHWAPVGAGAKEVVVVGAGPAGLYAALGMPASKVFARLLLERGKDVRSRRRDLAKLNREHLVNPNSNYCFGEGGAGTYSDGKLYTRSKKRGDIREALEWMVAHGADPQILVDAHPHIGTNRLPAVVTAMRETIERAGGSVLFDTKVVDVLEEDGRCVGVEAESLTDGSRQTIRGEAVILATGHSARDIFEWMHDRGLEVEAKPFALGVRVEHPQDWVNQVQYHGEPVADRLPPASYSLVCQVNGRGVHSFCMCPGGIVAPCATRPGEVVTNGWSPSKRNNPYANSGMVVQVGRRIGKRWALKVRWAVCGSKKAWRSPVGKPPAKRKRPRPSGCPISWPGARRPTLPSTSYVPGVVSARLDQILPEVVARALREGFTSFGRKMTGFVHPEAVVMGPESRTSSPVRIPRDPDTLQHPGLRQFYPTGEGGGYAGGILSAAMDGRKAPVLQFRLIG